MPITTEVVLDTNILLRTSFDLKDAPSKATLACAELLNRGYLLTTTVANLAEFANVATRSITPDNGLDLSSQQVQARLRIFESQLTIYCESLQSYEIWKSLIAKYDVRGKQVHDARIAAIMIAEGIRGILTFNTSDFRRFPEIVSLHPDDVLAQP